MPEASRCTRSFFACAPATWNTWCVISGTGECDLVDRVRDRVAQEPFDQLVDAVVQRRREQHALTTGRCGSQDTGDAGKKAQVSHVIGFVDDGDLDRVEADDALLHQVFEPAGAGDDDVDTRPQR